MKSVLAIVEELSYFTHQRHLGSIGEGSRQWCQRRPFLLPSPTIETCNKFNKSHLEKFNPNEPKLRMGQI